MLIKLAILLLVTVTYTLVRYVTFGTVSVVQIPVYLLNKSIALAAVCCLLLAAFYLSKQMLKQTKQWGIASFHFAAVHVLLSNLIISSDYFPKLFDSNRMNLMGELTLLFGVLAGYALWHARYQELTQIKPKVFQIIASVFILGHLITLGYTNWLNVGLWYGRLPPISLLSFIIVIISILFLIKHKFQRRDVKLRRFI